MTTQDMDASTLYYTFSTYAQVVSAVVAIIAAFVHFRIKAVQDLLIGHGQSVLNRWGEPGYRLQEQDELQRKRLVDAIGRRSISEIEAVIRLLRDEEIAQGHTLKDRPGGLQNLYDQRFRATQRLFQLLRSMTTIVVSAAFGLIATSIICIAIAETLAASRPIASATILAHLIGLGVILSLSWKLVRLGLREEAVL